MGEWIIVFIIVFIITICVSAAISVSRAATKRSNQPIYHPRVEAMPSCPPSHSNQTTIHNSFNNPTFPPQHHLPYLIHPPAMPRPEPLPPNVMQPIVPLPEPLPPNVMQPIVPLSDSSASQTFSPPSTSDQIHDPPPPYNPLMSTSYETTTKEKF